MGSSYCQWMRLLLVLERCLSHSLYPVTWLAFDQISWQMSVKIHRKSSLASQEAWFNPSSLENWSRDDEVPVVVEHVRVWKGSGPGLASAIILSRSWRRRTHLDWSGRGSRVGSGSVGLEPISCPSKHLLRKRLSSSRSWSSTPVVTHGWGLFSVTVCLIERDCKWNSVEKNASKVIAVNLL